MIGRRQCHIKVMGTLHKAEAVGQDKRQKVKGRSRKAETERQSLPSLPSWTSLLMATFAFSMVQTATDSPL